MREREHCFYRDVAPLMNMRVPAVLVNIAEPPCLVLEDLAPATVGDHVAGATLDQAERAIDVIARHHASWFEHPAAAHAAVDAGARRSVDPDDRARPSRSAGPSSWSGSATSCRRERCDGASSSSSRSPTWIDGHFDDRITLTHGDFRLDNLFFLDDGSVAVIDWQMCMRAPGQTDLVYFCANNLTVESRRDYEVGLIRRYVDGLHAAGVPADAVTFDAVMDGYLEGLVFYAMTFGASLLTIDPANERGAALFDVLVTSDLHGRRRSRCRSVPRRRRAALMPGHP